MDQKFDQERAEAVRTLIVGLLERMTLPTEVIIETPTLPIQGEFVCQIRITGGSSLLIGQHGQNLEALQTLVRLIARHLFEGWANFSIDANNYWAQKTQALFAEAKDAEKKAQEDKSSVFLRPMTAFERKCVHLALADSETVVTESIGTSETRKVIVKPKGDL